MPLNDPVLWSHALPVPSDNDHKYSRGQAVILAAPDMAGATVLAAVACARIGAGIVRVIVPDLDAKRFFQTLMPPFIVVTDEFDNVYYPYTKAVLAGPGLSGGDVLLDRILDRKPDNAQLVLDGGALSHIGKTQTLKNLRGAVITPHEGEYKGLFGEKASPGAMAGAHACTIVRKGARTVIASNNRGETVENRHASPWLASAGTGDVLAGMITGLTAQGMDPFDACCAAVWINGEAGRRVGPGLVATDLWNEIPRIYAALTDTGP